jgi:hypothetical protein
MINPSTESTQGQEPRTTNYQLLTSRRQYLQLAKTERVE